MSRESFLARVRAAAHAGRAFRVHTQEVPPDAGYAGAAHDDLCLALAQQVQAVGGVAQVVDTWYAAREAVGELLARPGVASALCWRHPTLEQLGLADLLEERGIQRLDYDVLAPLSPEEQRRLILAADIGITGVERAVAETGSLMMWHLPGQERTASLLPPVHVAVVAQSRIVPDLFDAFAVLAPRAPSDLPSNVTFITGPSKTGDIELELTTGVHGPGQWHVIVVREG